MQAIALVETGRSLGGIAVPWPWTLNVKGEGYWYPTRAEALEHAEREIAGGSPSVDLGCFQLNYRWHGTEFATPDEMLDPQSAADYAARFLAGLYAETGDWMRAAGLYHSRTPAYADRYRGRIGDVLARLNGAGAGNSAVAFAPSPNPKPEPESQPGPRARAPVRSLWAGAVTLATLHATGSAGRGSGGAAAGAVALRMFTAQPQPLLVAAGPLLAGKR